MNRIFIVVAIVLCSCSWPCRALRCRTEDGPGEDELKKIARICMKKVGENDSNSDEESRASNEDNDGDNYGMTSNNNNNNYNSQRNGNNNNNHNYYNNPYNGQSESYPGENRGNSFGRPQQSPREPNWPSPNGNNYEWNGNQSYGSASSMGGRVNGRTGNGTNQTEHDRACFVHCFFRELKLTNGDDQPDKFKMLTVLTRSIRDVELKQFHIDSIQECFHMIEHMDNYRRRNDKCDTAQTIANCLTERAKANCDDFADDVMIL